MKKKTHEYVVVDRLSARLKVRARSPLEARRRADQISLTEWEIEIIDGEIQRLNK